MSDRRRVPKKAFRFHDLTWHRVHEVLLVSSPYDAFILQQDGPLSEQVFREYSSLSLPASPRFTHVATGAAAIQRLKKRRFDLVLTMTSLADMNVNAFGRRVKKLRPGRPVVMLALDRKELLDIHDRIDREAIDGAFLWTGDPKILFAIIQYIEDSQNLDLDIRHGNLQAIIVVEDNPAYYSAFLGLLYKQLMTHSFSLYKEGLNEIHRQMQLQSRPKVLLATSYEEGVSLFKRYRKNVLALICDMRLPRGGALDPRAGLSIVRKARRHDPDLPVLLQSAEPENRAHAKELEAGFIDKNSHELLAQVGDFLIHSLGFGPFVFRLADGTEVAQARHLQELEEKLARVPEESLFYHARHNHFSIWLKARSEFALARQIRPRKVEEFEDSEAVRWYLIEALRDSRSRTHRGEVADFDRRRFDRDPFIRLGKGSLGGKARGMAFLHRTIAELDPQDFGGLEVTLPKTVVLTTELFDRFLQTNDLRRFAFTCDDDEEITRRFLAGKLDPGLASDLKFIVERIPGPIAVRSSSLLEDSRHQRLAGIYTTLMLPNSGAPSRRHREVCDAVRLVYASTYFANAKAYLRRTGRRMEEDHMAVILEEVVGQPYGRRFYPQYSGVAQSYNYYPIHPQKPEQGIAHIALGFGRQVVDGGRALRFCPQCPEVLPQFSHPKSLLDKSQRTFFALDMEQRSQHPLELLETLVPCKLETAEADGTLDLAGSVYCMDDQQIRDDLGCQGPRVITFNNILKHQAIPLAQALSQCLEIGKEGFGESVEIEFAGDMGDWGRPVRGRTPRPPRLFLLQIRPFAGRNRGQIGQNIRFAPQDLLCTSMRALGNGVDESVRDILYAPGEPWSSRLTQSLVHEIETFNRALQKEKRPYLLIGPGRWGTADPWLGVPVGWSQLSNVKAIVETSPSGYPVEPSQGTHFFQNLTSLEIGYFTLPPDPTEATPSLQDHPPNFLDRGWLTAQPVFRSSGNLLHIRCESPLAVVIDGRSGRGFIAKPGARRLD